MQALHDHIAKDGFRLRGLEMSRLDAFSDVVFGFALTLLVVSLEVPKTYDELRTVLLGFLPFSICFLFLIMIWWAHFRFFRRYGLHDFATMAINSCLLFCVLFYVYPLKFLFNLTIATTEQEHHIFSNPNQTRHLMVIYGIGFAAINFCLAAMYFNAWRQRHHLRLNPLEITLTLISMADDIGTGCFGLICALGACLLAPANAGDAGFLFFGIGIFKTIHGIISGKRTRLAIARTPHSEREPLPHAM